MPKNASIGADGLDGICQCRSCEEIDSDRRLAYLAGFFDGEGSIYARNGLQVSAVQIDRTPLLLLQGEFGGRVTDPRRTGSPTSVWRIYGQPAAEALRALFPYLIVKSEQAKLALQYATLVQPRSQAHHGRQVSDEIKAQREYLRQRIMRTRRGTSTRREGGEMERRRAT